MKRFKSYTLYSIFIALFLLWSAISLASTSEIDSLEILLQTAMPSQKIDILNELSSINGRIAPQKAIDYGKLAQEYANQEGLILGEADAYYNIGKSYFYMGNYRMSLNNYQKALVLSNRLEDKGLTSDILRGIGVSLDALGEYENALENYDRSLKIKEEIGDKEGVAKALNCIGGVFLNMKDYDQSLKYYEQSLKIKTELGDSAAISRTLNNMGAVCFVQKKFDNVNEYYQRSIAIKESLNDRSGIAATFINLASVAESMKQYDKAISYLKDALSINKELGTRQGIISALSGLGSVYNKKGNNIVALKYYKESLELSVELQQRSSICSNYKSLSEIYEQIGNNKTSLLFLKKHLILKDSLFNSENAEMLTNVKVQYETEAKEKEIELLNKEKEYNEDKYRKQRVFLTVLYIVVILVLIYTVILIRNSSQKRKANLLLEKQKWEILEQADLLEQKNTELEKLSIVASKTDNGVLIADAELNIVWVNEGFTRLLGYTLEEFIEHRGPDLISSSSNPEIREILRICREEKISVNYNTQPTTKDGHTIWLQTTLTPILDENGIVRRYIAIESDISDTKKAEELIKQKNTDITDSLNYANRIQHAILPFDEDLDKVLGDFFIFYKPKEIISGDFYWVTKRDDNILIAAADCTGHGVPGAFMSILGMTLLDEIINKLEREQFLRPDLILNLLRDKIIRILHQKGTIGEAQDGMDISLGILNRETMTVQYSGANNSLYIIRKSVDRADIITEHPNYIVDTETSSVYVNILEEIKADMMPIGIYNVQNVISFTNNELKVSAGDRLYFFTDGFPDQFGGKKGKKYNLKNFKKLILETSEVTMTEQKKLIILAFEQWKDFRATSLEQIDDILIMGIEV